MFRGVATWYQRARVGSPSLDGQTFASSASSQSRCRRGWPLLFLPLCSIVVAGCSNSIDALIATPTPTQVSGFAGETGVLTVTDATGTRPMYSSEYLLASINYTNQKCDEFFDRLARFQQDSSFVDKVLASSITAATPLMAAYGVAAGPVAVTAATVAYAQNINKFTSEIYAFAPYASQLKRHVKDQMTDYLKGISSDWKMGRLQSAACSSTGGCYNEVERLVVVRGRAQQYANICSIANLRAIVDSSLSNTKSVCDPTTTTLTATAVTNCKSAAITPAK
jgi:hypothetical protein